MGSDTRPFHAPSLPVTFSPGGRYGSLHVRSLRYEGGGNDNVSKLVLRELSEYWISFTSQLNPFIPVHLRDFFMVSGSFCYLLAYRPPVTASVGSQPLSYPHIARFSYHIKHFNSLLINVYRIRHGTSVADGRWEVQVVRDRKESEVRRNGNGGDKSVRDTNRVNHGSEVQRWKRLEKETAGTGTGDMLTDGWSEVISGMVC